MTVTDDMGIYQHARLWGYYVNPNQLLKIIKGLQRNYEKYGEPYCPCKVVSGDKEKDAMFICPCEQHHKEIEETVSCNSRRETNDV